MVNSNFRWFQCILQFQPRHFLHFRGGCCLARLGSCQWESQAATKAEGEWHHFHRSTFRSKIFIDFFFFRKKWWRRDLELGMKQFPTRRTLKSPTKNAQNRGGASLFDEAIAFRDRCNDDMTSVVCCGMQWQYPLDTSMKFIIHTTFKCNLTHDVLQWPKNKKQEKTCGLTHGN